MIKIKDLLKISVVWQSIISKRLGIPLQKIEKNNCFREKIILGHKSYLKKIKLNATKNKSYYLFYFKNVPTQKIAIYSLKTFI